MKYLALAFFLLTLFYPAIGQKSEAEFTESLSQFTDEGYRVAVENDTPVDFNGMQDSQKIAGYRVRIFFDNKQDSRVKAHEAIEEFKTIYPNMSTILSYQAPYFKVTVGSFYDKTEAVAVWGRLLKTFNTAFVLSDSIYIYELFSQDTLPIVVDSLQLDSTRVVSSAIPSTSTSDNQSL